ncbi:MAG: endopeptidase La [Fimbriimonadaceae bacterium]|nr:MAG: ATP-dependent proteinase [Armatimonadetes bacterium OLB18]MBV6491525.1 Lon protease 2 [Fimbriimonadaceae bacterium]MCL4285103.1 endopeptidase La [Fimbriimonadaceae bacterium]QOJ10518.1 MAG: endopeptidase La [Chthonomonadaceae bacterium]WKZ81133.1 MAG: endopeptidase La [Fimbriimonadaceae bacterium]
MSDVKTPLETEPTEPELEAELHDEDPSSEEFRPEVPTELSILPLRDSVIYPMLIAPLSVARDSSIQLIDESIVGNNRVIGVIAQRKPHIEQPTFDDVYETGCAVIIRTLVKMPDAVRLIVQGISRFRIVERLQETPYLRARVEVIDETPAGEDTAEDVEALRRSVAALFEQAIRLSPQLPDELRSLTQAVQETNVMCDLVAAHMTLSLEDKQSILETVDIQDRLRALLEMLSKEVRVLELTSKVQSEVNVELSKSQREYYLREQLKAIQRELGESDDRSEELEELHDKIEQAGMPQEALREVHREFDRLRRMSPGAPEYTVARTYIDWMVSLPWSSSTEDNVDLTRVRDVLDSDHFGLDKIKERILEFLAVRKVKKDGKIRQPILCFVGPPGVGKTSLGRSISHAMNRNFIRISLGGMRDEAEIRGHRRTYIGALPGQIIQGLRRAESNNPVFMLDEIDKLGMDFRGDPASALLEVLDPEQNVSFRDHYIDAPFDLSRVFFITTANRLDTVPPPLRDRMEVIELGGYTEDEKLEIAKRHLIGKQVEEHGLRPSQIQFEDRSVRKLIHNYTREAGVRNLERAIAGVVRRATRLFAEGRRAKVVVSEKFLESALGAPRFLNEEVEERNLQPGMAVGLAWTPVGGDVLFVESAKMPGSKGLIVTGQLGDVMKESVQAALSYIRSRSSDLRIDPDIFDKHEIHVHVPAGAVPKDGPSAGITMLVALVSLLTGKTIRRKLAMSGEITLSGHVLPVGGIKEKVLAAKRAGVTTIILPEDNKKDYLEDVPEEVRQELKVHFVSRVEPAVKIAFDKK